MIGETFLDGAPCAVILGYNNLHGGGLTEHILAANNQTEGVTTRVHRLTFCPK